MHGCAVPVSYTHLDVYKRQIQEEQMLIMQEHGETMIGKTVTVMTEGFDRYAECYFGRTEADAPEIDGKVFFTISGKKPQFGQFVKVEICLLYTSQRPARMGRRGPFRLARLDRRRDADPHFSRVCRPLFLYERYSPGVSVSRRRT